MNKIILLLVFVIGTGFLFLSYQTDTLGKFSHFMTQKQVTNAVIVPLQYDSYGGACAPNTNHGDKYLLIASNDPEECKIGPNGGNKQIYLKFDSSKVSKGFTKATLFLKVDSSNQKGEFEIYSMELPWKEAEVRWNGPTSGIYWYGAGLSTKDLSHFSTAFKIDGPDEYVTVDVTRHVKYWIEESKNYGLVIKAVDGSLEIMSRESDEPAFILVK